MKRVCIVTPDLAGPTRTGGIGTHCLYLARFLARRGDEVTIVHTGPPDDTDREAWKCIYRDEHRAALLYLDELPDEPALPILPHTPQHRTAHRIYRWLRGEDFAEVHFQDWQGNGAIAARARHTAAALAGTRLIVTTHGSSEWIREGMQQFPTEGRETLIDDALERTAVALADTVISPTRHMIEWMKAHGWTLPGDTIVAPYLFEPPEAEAAPRALPPGMLREIVFYGRLETRKGLEPFLGALEMLAGMAPSLPPLRVYFVGKHHLTQTGPSSEAIARTAAASGDRLAFEVASELDHTAALNFLREHPDALVVMPSLADNAPFTITECLALGNPFLAGNRGGIPELVRSPDHLVEPTAAELARRIREVFEAGLPPCPPMPGYGVAAAAWTTIVERAVTARLRVALPHVSVCIPHFNQVALLATALQALRDQTLSPHEVIVVDDGSESANRAGWDALAAEYEPIGWRFLRQDRAGPSAARNLAAGQATGDAFVFCDADNLPAPDMLERLATALAASGADIVTCAFTAFRAESPDAGGTRPEYVFSPLGDSLELALLENFVGDVNLAVRRSVFAQLGGFDAANRAASEDWQFLLRALLNGVRVAVLPEPVFRYRLAPASHARRTSSRTSAEAAWRELSRAQWPDLERLLLVARGTFEDRPRLARLPEVEAVLAAVRQHARQLEQLTAELRGELDSSLAHSANLQSLLDVRERELREALADASNLRSLVEVRARELAEALTHSANLARLLETARNDVAASQQHAANLQALVDTATADLGSAQKHAQNLERFLAVERARGQELARKVSGLEGSVARLQTQQVEMTAAHEAALRQRDDKITRMQSSLSWKITAPLRLLRRMLVDRFLREPAATLTAALAGQTTACLCAIDRPSSWSGIEARRVQMAGWVVRTNGQPIGGVRARVGEAVFAATTGIRRPDVKAALPANAAAETSGFTCDIRLDGASGIAVVEALSPAGRWDAIHRAHYTLAQDATETPPDPFTRWIARHEDSSDAAIARMREQVTTWSAPPLIAVVMPVYNTPEKWLTAAIDSVRRQAYPHWELCIADDASPAPHVRPLLERVAREDTRIKVTFRETNGHICAASNSALALATGEWMALLDHDDELAPHALFEMAAAIRANPDVALIYSDEDKVDETGRRFDPYFKPGFLPDLLEGQNFICHLGVYRAALVRELGGFREGFEGSQDWDLALRVVDHAGAAAIKHVPRILYHWRAIAGSTALHGDQKNYYQSAARRALADHFERRGERVELVEVPGGHWRVRHAVPEPHPLVSVIIPTRNGLHLIRRCVESIEEKTTYDRFEIVIVDNGSDDPAMLAWLRDMQERRKEGRGHTRVLRDESPFNYSALNNRAVATANGGFVCLLNNDMEIISPDWLDEMVSHAARPGVGCVGAMLYYPDDTIQHAGVVLGVGGVAGHAFKRFPRGSEGVFNRARLVQNYSAVTAACLLVRKSTFLSVGGLDENDLSVAFNDVDFCLKVRAAGHRNVWTPFAEFYHHESASRGFEDTPEKHARFRREIEIMQKRWGALLMCDPAYNPNLSLESEDFAIATARRAASGS